MKTGRLTGVVWLAVGSAIFSNATYAGPYTTATISNQLCEEGGRKIAEFAFEAQADHRRTLAKQAELRSAHREAVASKDKDAIEVAAFALDVYKPIFARDKEFLAKHRKVTLDYATEVFGKRWRPVAEKVWSQVLPVNEQQAASDIGYAVCMDAMLRAVSK